MGRVNCLNCGSGLYTGSTASVQCSECEGWFHKSHQKVQEDGIVVSVCARCEVGNSEVMLPSAPMQTHDSARLEDLLKLVEEHVKKIETLERKVEEMQNIIEHLQGSRTTDDSLSLNTITMKPGDLLEAAESHSIAHCIAQDLLMEDGIAKIIKQKFSPNIEDLRTKSQLGEILVQQNGDNYVLHLVTKNKSKQDKPTSKVFKKTIHNLAKKCEELGIRKLSIPKIESGLDKQPWEKTMRTLKSAFERNKTQVTVLYLRDKETQYRAKLRNKKLKTMIPKTIPKIEIFGESNTRDMGPMLRRSNPQLNTLVTVRPGATTGILCHRLNANTAHLTPEDILFVLSGTNDMKKSYGLITTNYYEAERKHLISQSKHVNLCIISIPHRYDDEDYNEHINTYNMWLQNICTQKQVKFIDINVLLNKEDYASDGLHFKEEGKSKIVQHLSQIAKDILQEREESFQ